MQNNNDSISSMLKDVSISDNSAATSVTTASSLLDESDMWNLDLDDILDMPANNPLRRTMSSCTDTRGPTLTRTSTGTDIRKPRDMVKRIVSFDKVKIRVFEQVLSDNPTCTKSGGPSIGLGWDYTEKKDMALEKFETKRLPRRTKSKDMEVLSPEKRLKMARKMGYTPEQILRNVKRVEKTHKQRSNTSKALSGERPKLPTDAYAIMQHARKMHGRA